MAIGGGNNYMLFLMKIKVNIFSWDSVYNCRMTGITHAVSHPRAFTLLELLVVVAMAAFEAASGTALYLRAHFFDISTFSARSGKRNRREWV